MITLLVEIAYLVKAGSYVIYVKFTNRDSLLGRNLDKFIIIGEFVYVFGIPHVSFRKRTVFPPAVILLGQNLP